MLRIQWVKAKFDRPELAWSLIPSCQFKAKAEMIPLRGLFIQIRRCCHLFKRFFLFPVLKNGKMRSNYVFLLWSYRFGGTKMAS